MKDEDDKKELILYESTPCNRSDRFKDMFMSAQNLIVVDEGQVKKRKDFIFIGVDWAKDSSMNRGDVISRKNNVTEVRFSTVTLK